MKQGNVRRLLTALSCILSYQILYFPQLFAAECKETETSRALDTDKRQTVDIENEKRYNILWKKAQNDVSFFPCE